MERDELRAIQAPLKERYEEAPDSALMTLKVRFELETGADEEELATLLKLTERYCVVFQTLATPPELSAAIAT